MKIALSAKVVKRKRGRPRLSEAERERRATALTAVKTKRKRVKRVAVKKRDQMDHAATWRASYVAERYSISMSLVYKLVRTGKLPHKRVGTSKLIPAAACIAYFESAP